MTLNTPISQAAAARREGARNADGQFGRTHHQEADDLVLPEMDAETMSARGYDLSLLADEGFVPSMAHRTSRSPGFVDDHERSAWWRDHAVSGEHSSHERGQVAKMPDDYTPSSGGGQSFSGKRRTHRMGYSGSGVTVRMPSVSSVRRYANDEADSHGGTFDVPVEIDDGGDTHSGWVRVSERGGRYAVDANDFPPHSRAVTAEAVNSLLEARRVRTALTSMKSLDQRADERRKSHGIQGERVASSWIGEIGYDDDSHTMVMATTSGKAADVRAYGYRVDRDTMEEVAGARSPGQAYNRIVKNKAKTTPVQRCGDCGRFTSAGSVHACPIEHAGPAAGSAHRSNDVYAEVARAVTTPMIHEQKARESTPVADDVISAEQARRESSAFGQDVVPSGADTADHSGQTSLPDETPASPLPDVPPPTDADAPSWMRRTAPATPESPLPDVLPPTDDDAPSWVHAPRRERNVDSGPTTDLGREFARQAAEVTSGERQLFGDPGFTTGAADRLAHLDTGRMQASGLFYFKGGGPDEAKFLLDDMPDDVLDMGQRSGPTMRSVLEASRDNPSMQFHGYIAPPERSDERVTIEAVTVDVARPLTVGYETYDDVNDNELLWERMQDQYGFDGEWPDEIDVEKVDAGNIRLHAWWD